MSGRCHVQIFATESCPERSPKRIVHGGLLEDSCGWSIVLRVLAATTNLLAFVLTSLICSDRLRSCPDLRRTKYLISRDLWYSLAPLLVNIVLWTVVSLSHCGLTDSKNTLLSQRREFHLTNGVEPQELYWRRRQLIKQQLWQCQKKYRWLGRLCSCLYQFRGFNPHRVHILVRPFLEKRIITGKRESVSEHHSMEIDEQWEC